MHTDRVKDAGQKRREYLLQKASGRVVGIILSIYALAVAGFALVLIHAAVQSIRESGSNTVFFAILATAVIAFGLHTGRRAALSFRESRSIPYVPSVAEQIAALPTEAILVRGSDEPAAAPGELLRAAAGTETEVGELLRAATEAPCSE